MTHNGLRYGKGQEKDWARFVSIFLSFLFPSISAYHYYWTFLSFLVSYLSSLSHLSMEPIVRFTSESIEKQTLLSLFNSLPPSLDACIGFRVHFGANICTFACLQVQIFWPCKHWKRERERVRTAADYSCLYNIAGFLFSKQKDN